MGIIKQKLKDHLPEGIARRLRVLLRASRFPKNFIYDGTRFFRWSSIADCANDNAQLLALISVDYHRIEKGLSLRSPRVWFGAEVVRRLSANIERYLAEYGEHQVLFSAIAALDEYARAGAASGEKRADAEHMIATLKAKLGNQQNVAGGTKKMTRESVLDASKIDLSGFFMSRASVRQFSPEPVDIESVLSAVRLSLRTPSVCNRQPWRVHILSQPEHKSAALACQSGNRGFGEEIDKLLLITSDLRSFIDISERNQCWIDGGLFTMSLVYALHSLGLATCCLNWSADCRQDQKLRALGIIPDNEVVIMMLAVGHYPDEFAVAQSYRRDLDEIVTTH